jgi:Flp pilus assembly protein TadD
MLLSTIGGLLQILSLGLAAYFLNVLLHELGHAVPVLFWSKEKVTVFVGSLGDPGQSLRFRIGRLEIFLKYNPFLWVRGLCKPGETLSVRKQLFFIAMGPVTSLLITVSCWLVLVVVHPDQTAVVILVAIMVTGGVFTLSSAIPGNKLLYSHSGKILSNDATQFVGLWRSRKLPPAYWQAMKHIHDKEFDAGIALLEQPIQQGYDDAILLRLAVGVHLQLGNYERANELHRYVGNKYGFNVNDHINDGYYKTMLGWHAAAMESYLKAQQQQPDHYLLLNNLGYTLVVLDRPNEAMPYLERAIFLSPKFAHAYNNRGWAKMKLGDWEEGLADVRHSLHLDEQSAYAYRNLGIYSLEKGRREEAREYFMRAKAIDPRVQLVDDYLAKLDRS